MQPRLAALCCACAALCLQPALAQQYTRANPADPDAATPSPQYRPAFEGYRPFRDEKMRPWREVNDEVERTGGHAGIFRSPFPGTAADTHSGHAGHHPGASK